MKWIKYFESKETSREKINRLRSDIIRVFVEYAKEFELDHHDLDDLIWSSTGEIAEEWTETRVLTPEMMSVILDEFEDIPRFSERILELYERFKRQVEGVDVDEIDLIEDIFFSYTGSGSKVNIRRDSSFSDNRFKVRIDKRDILITIDLLEIFKRLEDIGFLSYSINGVKNGSTEYVELSFWKKLKS